LWSPSQWRLLKVRAKIFAERKESGAEIRQAAEEFCEPGDVKSVEHVLGLLNVHSSSEGTYTTDSEQTSSALLASLRKEFPVATVISNRIMNSSCCEDVFRIYQSLGDSTLIEGYPIEELVAETVLLPNEPRDQLVYVPLPIPPAFTSHAPADFFRSFAVAMAPPQLVCPESFRDVAEAAASSLFTAHLIDSFSEIGDAAFSAHECRRKIFDGRLKEAAQDERRGAAQRLKGLLSTIRHFYPWTRYQELWSGTLRLPFSGVSWPQLDRQGKLAPLPPLVEVVDTLGEAVREASELPWRERVTMLDSTLRNVQHGGFIDEIGFCIASLDKLKDTKGAIRPHLQAIADQLQDIQGRHLLLADRIASNFQSAPLPSAIVSATLWNRLLSILDARLTKEQKETSEANPPHFVCRGDLVLAEEARGVQEIMLILLHNLIRHERASEKSAPWGCELERVDNPSRYLQEMGLNQLASAYELWRPELRAHDTAALLRAFPFSGDPDSIQLGCTGVLQIARSGQRGLGTYCLGAITRAYCQPSAEGDSRWHAQHAIQAVRGDGVFVLIPIWEAR
jgi:hypothetical protein